MKKILLVFVLSTTCIVPAFSQVNLQFFGSYVRNLNKNSKGNTSGGGVRVEFGDDEKAMHTYIGFAYNRPIVRHETLEARAYSNFTTPETIPVEAVYKIPNYRLEFGTRYYLTGSAHNYESINIFIHIGAEVNVAPNKPTYESFDRDLYTLGYTSDSDVNEDGTEKVAINLMLSPGVGIEKNLGPGNIFAHITISVPVTQNGGSDISASIEDFTPLPLNFNIGYKIPLSSSK